MRVGSNQYSYVGVILTFLDPTAKRGMVGVVMFHSNIQASKGGAVPAGTESKESSELSDENGSSGGGDSREGMCWRSWRIRTPTNVFPVPGGPRVESEALRV